MNKNNDEKDITGDLIKLKALETKYDVLLSQYNEAYQTFNDTLTTLSQDPCATYGPNDLNVSQQCYAQIWSKAGCTATPPDPSSNVPYNDIVYNTFTLSTATDTASRQSCYGDNWQSATYNTATSPDYSSRGGFSYMQRRNFWGTKGLAQTSATSPQQCELLCASDSNCTGATFDSAKQYCWTRSGEGAVLMGDDNEYAILPKFRLQLSTLKTLNDKLTQINNEIITLIDKMQPKEDTLQQEKIEKQKELNRSYVRLQAEKIQLEKTSKEYRVIDETYNNNSIYITQQTTIYKLWALFAFIFIFMIFRQSTSGFGKMMMIITGLIIFMLVVVILIPQ